MGRSRLPVSLGALLPAGARKQTRPAYWPPGVESELEMMLLTRLERAGLPLGVGQHKIVPGRMFTWDRCWIEQRVCVEVQGAVWVKGAHSSGGGIERDCLKASMAAAIGWRCLPITKAMLNDGSAVRLIAQALAARVGTSSEKDDR